MTTLNEGERMPRIRNGTLRRTNLILLAFMFLGVTMAQAQDSLVDLQKRKTIAEAEKEAIEAEIARDEARKKQSELVAPLDPVKKAKDDAVEAANSAEAIADAKKAQPDAQSPCSQCIKASQEEVKKCLDAAISQEDKKSCLEKQETRSKTCEDGECKIERTQGGSKAEVPTEKK
jgi:multidrug efflux pump subunit AcrA (membrane-fusion protein)